MRDLAPCPRCRRLLRHRDVTCPFCFAVRVVALAAILPLSVACQRGTTATPDAAPVTTTSASTATDTAAVSASASVVPPLTSASASLTPSAIASVKQAAIGRDGGAGDSTLLAALGADAGLLALLSSSDAGGLVVSPGVGLYGGAPSPGIGPGIGAYGGAPSPGLGSLGQPNVTASMGGGHLVSDDRIIASRRPMLRACYLQGLTVNPDASGKLKLKVQVAADGKGTATASSTSGNLSDQVKACMTRVVGLAQYEATAHDFEVDVTANPAK